MKKVFDMKFDSDDVETLDKIVLSVLKYDHRVAVNNYIDKCKQYGLDVVYEPSKLIINKGSVFDLSQGALEDLLGIYDVIVNLNNTISYYEVVK